MDDEFRRSVFPGVGVELVADVAGEPEAPTLLFLHGGGQTRKSWGAAVKEAGRRGYRAVSLDLRGHGESGWSPDGYYGIELFIEDVRAVITALTDAPVLVGASIGGVIGLLLASDHPSEVGGLVLVDAVARGEKSGMDEIGAFMRSAKDGFVSLDQAADAVAAYLPHRKRPSDPSGLLKNLKQREDGRYVWHWDPAFLNPGGNIRPDPDRLEDAARKLTVPTLLIRGGRSRVVSREGAKAFLELVPHADFVDVADADHMVAGDDNDRFNAAVFDFLNRHRPVEKAIPPPR